LHKAKSSNSALSVESGSNAQQDVIICGAGVEKIFVTNVAELIINVNALDLKGKLLKEELLKNKEEEMSTKKNKGFNAKNKKLKKNLRMNNSGRETSKKCKREDNCELRVEREIEMVQLALAKLHGEDDERILICLNFQ